MVSPHCPPQTSSFQDVLIEQARLKRSPDLICTQAPRLSAITPCMYSGCGTPAAGAAAAGFHQRHPDVRAAAVAAATKDLRLARLLACPTPGLLC